MPESVVAGQSFIIAIDVSAVEALFDNNVNAMIDSSGAVMLPSGGSYKSAYTGDQINNFVSEVLS